MFIRNEYLYIMFSMFLIPTIVCQVGPDPWQYDEKPENFKVDDEGNIPPDLRIPIKKKALTENKLGIGEWFFKRTLAIVLKGGQIKKEEDGAIDITLKMKLDPKQWDTLNECLNSESTLTEDKYRRAVSYVEESIYKPSVTEQIVMAWSDYVHYYLTEYKTYITWTLLFMATAGGAIWLWRHMSHKHAIIIVLIIFYAYEVFISYKEAEQKELDKFLSAVNKCKWYFWTSECDVPAPDPVVFLKHMNPMKIGIRMFSAALAEPFVAISDTVNTILHGVTDGLMFPLNKIVNGFLTVMINISFIYFLLMIIFNWVLNIPFHFGFFGFGISLRQRERNLFFNSTATQQPQLVENTDRISQTTVDKILNVCTLALSSNNSNHGVGESRQRPVPALSAPKPTPGLKRSSSTGRLPNHSSSIQFDTQELNSVVRRRYIPHVRNFPRDGSGDAGYSKVIDSLHTGS